MPEWQTGKILIRLLLQKQSDLGLPCLSKPFQAQTMLAASQLPGKGPTNVDDAPLHLHVNQKYDYDYDDLP